MSVRKSMRILPPARSPETTSGDGSSRKPYLSSQSQHRSGSMPPLSHYHDPLSASPKAQVPDERDNTKSTSSSALTSSKSYKLPTLGSEDTRPISSADEIPTNRHDQLQASRKHLRKIPRLRDRILEIRTKLEMEQKRCEDHRVWLNESLEKFMKAAEDAVETGSLTSSFSQMTELFEQLKIDHTNLIAQEAVTKQLQCNLGNQEYETMTAEKQLGDIFAILLSTLDLEFEDSECEDMESIEPPTTRSGYENPLVADYYTRKGELGILRERLADLDYEHRVELADREVKIDQAILLNETPSEFRRRFESVRERINIQIISSEAHVRRLEEECKMAGFDIGSEKASSAESQNDDHSIQQPELEPGKVIYIIPGRLKHPIASDAADTSAVPTTRLRSEATTTYAKPNPVSDREFVHQWLHDITSDPGSDPSEGEHGERSLGTRSEEAVTERVSSLGDTDREDSVEDGEVSRSRKGLKSGN